jgi:hypothetical protein
MIAGHNDSVSTTLAAAAAPNTVEPMVHDKP